MNISVMKPSKTAGLYIAYLIGITVLFLYLLFPSEKIKAYLISQLSAGSPEITVDIRHVTPAFPPGIKATDIRFARRDKLLFGLDELKITPNISSWFASTNQYDFKVSAYEGQVSGDVVVSGQPPQQEISLDADIKGIQIEKIAALQQITDYKLTGRVDGDITFNNRQSLVAKLVAYDGRIEFPAPLFNQQNLSFKTVNTNLEIRSQRLAIKNCDAKGTELDASISGTVNLRNHSGTNVLRLNGVLKPHHAFWAKIEKKLPANFLRKKNVGKSGIAFEVNGSLENPEFSIN